MSRCGCSGSTCSCRIEGRGSIRVTGGGSATNPYIIDGGTTLTVRDSPTVDLSLSGDGSASSPWSLSADAKMGLRDLTDLDSSGAQPGYVIARKADGSYHLAPAATTAPGAISAGDGITGDGSAAAPLSVHLGPSPGLVLDANGLSAETRVVNTVGELDAKYGNVPNGTLVTKADGTMVWSKIASGWTEVVQDKSMRLPVDALGGPYTSGGWWELPFTTTWKKIPKPPRAGEPAPDITFTAPADGVVMIFGIVNGGIDANEAMHLRFRVDVVNGAGGNPFYGRISGKTGSATNITQSCHLTTLADVTKGQKLEMSIGYYYMSLTGSAVAGNLMKVTDVRLNAVFIPNGVEILPPSTPRDGDPADGQPLPDA